MNDYTEGHYGYTIFEKAADQILKDKNIPTIFKGISVDFFDEIDKKIAPTQLFSHPIICCFSKKPDVLSQWRGYAANATGFSIGFSTSALKQMPITLLEVEYDPEKQIAEMREALLTLYLASTDNSPQGKSFFRDGSSILYFYLLGFKSSAFSEEQEVRCIHSLAVAQKGPPRVYFEDPTSGDEIPNKIKFRTNDGGIVTYVDIPLATTENAITEVYLGPKNTNGVGNVLYPLHAAGFADFEIAQSSASYR
ncbi:DUF2971 domain-containing protein [Labrys neptuniae]|uniref:DUF2971 domain-containing protein n=1 Tax=Labrys neptuniae TaxID=376174 RepID=UPI00288D2128|nr:DUF2971 domain-containing protein [Labrys neptuniae]MDT3377346.1 DUF2971 domain-containing protein [Labrys neptuniae]